MAEKIKKPAERAEVAKTVTKVAPRIIRKPDVRKSSPGSRLKPTPGVPKRVRAVIAFREGEYGMSVRVKFPRSYYLLRILEVTEPEKQKKYRFRHFNNILVAGMYSKDLSEFLQEGAKKAGFELEIVKSR